MSETVEVQQEASVPEWLVKIWKFAKKDVEFEVFQRDWDDEYPRYDLANRIQKAVTQGLMESLSQCRRQSAQTRLRIGIG